MMNTLVMIPALGCDEGLYAPLVPLLKPWVRVETVIPSADRFGGMAQDLLAQVAGQFIVLGTSMGGRLALEIALAAPDRVQGLVVIGASAGAVADPAAGLRRSSRVRGGQKAAVIAEMGDMISHLPGPHGVLARDEFVRMGRNMDTERLARQSDALVNRLDRWPHVAAIACPTLCLWGVHDQFSGTADGMRLAAAVPHGRYVEIAECGHFPSLEYPEETAAALEHWLRDSHLA